jgi:hypothetical protein
MRIEHVTLRPETLSLNTLSDERVQREIFTQKVTTAFEIAPWNWRYVATEICGMHISLGDRSSIPLAADNGRNFHYALEAD